MCTQVVEKAKGAEREKRKERLERRKSPSEVKLKDMGTNVETNRGSWELRPWEQGCWESLLRKGQGYRRN